MKDLNDVNQELAERLIELIGHKKANDFFKQVDNNYFAMLKKVLWCEIFNQYKLYPIRSSIITLIGIIVLIYFILNNFGWGYYF